MRHLTLDPVAPETELPTGGGGDPAAIEPGRGLPAALDPFIRTYRKGRGYGHAVGPALLRGSSANGPIVVGVPVERVSAIELSSRPLLSGAHQIAGVEGEGRVLEAALSLTADALLRRVEALAEREVVALEMRVRRRTDIRAGQGQGSASAEAAGAVRALAGAWGVELSESEISALVARAHQRAKAGSFSGGVWPGIVALNEDSGELIEPSPWWPRLALVIATPDRNVAGTGGSPARLEAGATQAVLNDLRSASGARDADAFLRVATGVAHEALRGDMRREELGDLIKEEAERVGADGIIGADPSLGLALAFCAERDGRNRAFAACRELSETLGAGIRVSTTITRPAAL